MMTTKHTPAIRKRLDDFLSTCTKESLHNAFQETWLNDIVPGIKELEGCDQGSKIHLEGDVAVHTALVFENLTATSLSRLGREPDFIERLSVVLHDLRKPDTREPQPDGSVWFPGHEAMAAEDVPQIAKTLGLSKEETDRLLFIVARHGDAHGLPELSQSQKNELTTSPWKISLALLQEADARSCLLTGGTYLPVYWSEIVGDTKVEQTNPAEQEL